MIISCITTASNKAVLIKGIPFRIVQIKGFCCKYRDKSSFFTFALTDCMIC